MKNKTTVFIVILICLLFIGLFVYQFTNDPWDEMYKDRTEYPLKLVDVNDASSYMIVKWQHSPEERYEIITDTQAIKDNVSTFRVDNDGAIYGTTSDGVIWLFKDGKQIDTVLFDNTHTKKIEYGSLRFQQINELQYQLQVGYEIIEQDKNYTIIRNNQNEKPYYYCFVHGENLEDIKTVYLLASESNVDKLPKPQKAKNGIIEFIAPFTTYAGAETRHWFFRLTDYKLSQSFINIRAVNESTVICTDSNYKGPSIVISDMFDKSVFYKKISGDFSKEADRLFLKSAVFTEDGKIKAEFIGEDEQIHTDVFSLD